MKKLLLASAVLAALSASVTAQAATPYVEGQLGIANATNTSTKSYSGTSGNVTATNLSATLDFDSSATYGFEFGYKDVIVPNLRLGASFNTMKFDLASAQINGQLTAGGQTYTGPVNLSRSQVNGSGLNFDNRVNLYMLNAYYDFKSDSQFTPFLGLGLGVADIKNAKDGEFAVSLSAGAKYNVDKNVYVSGKAAYTHVNGPTDLLGIKYDALEVYSANAAIGYEF
jgi:opacity protein-like surface antigen